MSAGGGGVGRGLAGRYTHDVLLHAHDEELVAATRAFVEEGLASGGQVLAHGSDAYVGLMRDALGERPGLTYGLDAELYQEPSATLFAYQQELERTADTVELWATGTVPMGDDPVRNAAWTRYESAVNAALAGYAFHGLCAYDTARLPADVVAAATATHPHRWTADGRVHSADYADPGAFLVDAAAQVPAPPAGTPSLTVSLVDAFDLGYARVVLQRAGAMAEVAADVLDGLVLAAHEVMVNGLRHGRPPVLLEVWVEPGRVTCRVTDHGSGFADLAEGYRHPGVLGPHGLWAARRSCEDLFLGRAPHGGATALLRTP